MRRPIRGCGSDSSRNRKSYDAFKVTERLREFYGAGPAQGLFGYRVVPGLEIFMCGWSSLKMCCAHGSYLPTQHWMLRLTSLQRVMR